LRFGSVNAWHVKARRRAFFRRWDLEFLWTLGLWVLGVFRIRVYPLARRSLGEGGCPSVVKISVAGTTSPLWQKTEKSSPHRSVALRSAPLRTFEKKIMNLPFPDFPSPPKLCHALLGLFTEWIVYFL
jgi:hypothetical protein